MSKKVTDAMQLVIKELRKDAGWRQSFVSNIAMSFKDEMSRNSFNFPGLHDIANKAAENFMDLWLLETLEEKKRRRNHE